MLKKRKTTNNLKIMKLFSYTIFLICLCIVFCAKFINYQFGAVSFEQLLYTVTTSEGADYSIVSTAVIYISVRIIVCLIIMLLLYKLYKCLKIKVTINYGIKNHILKLKLFKYTKIKGLVYPLILVLISCIYTFKILEIDDYILNQTTSSQLFEEYYVDGKNVELKFPNKKRNLIYIFLESMEMTNATIKKGGNQKKSYIPNLEKLALQNINFSNTSTLGGALQLNNTSWTMAALVAHTSGVPLKISIEQNSYLGYSDSLPGVYNLGDILKDNGYNNYFLLGSDATFGGRRDFFENHGEYSIHDYYYAIDKEYIDKDYMVWWGYEDKKLFEHAKKELIEISKEGEPFNYTILTVDTHLVDGYMDSTCKKVFDVKYANSLYCSDSKIVPFINWLKKQDFYDNTTIIIAGDHLTMQQNFYEESDYQRTIYNTIINSPIEPINEKNRLFSSFDLFPTTLAALNVEIKGDKLGLGVNLFSEEKTLLEEFGIEKFNEEISKKSFYYDNVLLGDTYYEMKENIEKE